MNYLESDYEYDFSVKGDRVVVDDIYESDLYVEDIEESERYEVRCKGLCLGRFGDLDDVERFLSDEFDDFVL